MAKPMIFSAALALSMAIFGANTTLAQEPPTASTVAATVNGTDITLGHMLVLRANLPAQYQSIPDETLFKGILDQLIQQTALSQSINGKTTLRDTLAMENDRRGYLAGVAIGAVVENAITDEALQTSYNERFADAEARKEYNAAHILVATEVEAKAIKAEIDAGGVFAELAQKHSSDGAAANGGDLGWFGAGMMVEPFQNAVFAMEVGSVSDPVQTQFGFHLIQLQETRIADAPKLDEVRDQLAEAIERKAVETHVEELTKAATITRPGEGIDPAILKDITLLDK
jgi:peptidyl-prolyl cis-trans isomerase C